MNEELRALLREAYNRGASREQLDVIVERYRASKKKEQPQEPFQFGVSDIPSAVPSQEVDQEPKEEDTFVNDVLASSDFYNPVGKIIKNIPGIAEVYSGVENLVGSVFKAGEMAVRENLFAYASSNPAVAATQNVLRTAAPIDNKLTDALGAMGDLYMESSQRTLLNKQKDYGISEEEISNGIVGNVIEGNIGTAAKLTASTIAHQIPQLAAMAATGPVAGAALLGTSAAGGKYAEIQDDPTLSSEEKALYSVAIGTAEGLAEYMFRTDVSQIRRAFSKKETLDQFKEALKKELKKETLFKSTVEEAGEELAVGVADLLIEDGLRGNFDNWDADAVLELADAALVGGLMGGGVHTATRGVSALGSSKNERKQAEIKSDISTLNEKKKNATEDEKKVIDELIEEKVGELIEVNTEDAEFYSNFSKDDLNEIISINKDIRKASKKYNAAKDSESLRKKYSEEIKSLRDKKQEIENKYAENPSKYIRDGKEVSRSEFVDMVNKATPEEIASGQWGVQNDEEVDQLLRSKLPKDDSKEEERVPSPVKEEKTPIKAEPIQEGGVEAPPTGGVVQEEARELKVSDDITVKAGDQVVAKNPVDGSDIQGTIIIEGDEQNPRVSIETETDIVELGTAEDANLSDIKPFTAAVAESESLTANEDGTLTYNVEDNPTIAKGTKLTIDKDKGLSAVSVFSGGQFVPLTEDADREQGLRVQMLDQDGNTVQLYGQDAIDATYNIMLAMNESEAEQLNKILDNEETIAAIEAAEDAARKDTELTEETAGPVDQESKVESKKLAEDLGIKPFKKTNYIDAKDLGKDERTPKRFKEKEVKQLQTMVSNFNKVLNKLGAQPIKITFAANNEQFETRYRELTGRSDGGVGKKGSFIPGKGEIVINLSKSDPTTLPHEMLHAYIAAVKLNPKKISEFTKVIESELRKGSTSDIKLANDLAAFRDEYVKRKVYGDKTKDDAEIAEEFLAQYVGVMANKAKSLPVSQQLSFIEKVRKAIVKFLGKLGIVDKSLAVKLETREAALAFINGFVNALQGRTGVTAKVNPESSAVVNSENPYQASRLQLEVPVGSRIANKPLKDARKIAIEYMESKGLKHTDGELIKKVDEANAKRISDAYTAMKNDPTNPEVAAAYKAMAEETLDQYVAIIKNGYKVEVNNNEPYNNSNELIEDLRNNKNMRIFSTDSGFGDEGITAKQRKENPLLAETKYKDVNGRTLLVNDVFRFVHDFFGHAERGNGFGPIGEENAWDVHSRMYGPLARKALTAETRGQNSYVNYSGVNDEAFKLRDKGRALRKEGKFEEAQEFTNKAYAIMKFAPQKVGLLPDEFVANPYLEEKVEKAEPVVKEQIDAVEIISSETPRQKAKKEAVAEMLNGFADTQLPPNSSEQDLISRFLNNIFEESLYTLKKGPRESGMTWYIEDITEFENKMTVLLPELSDPNQMKLFKQVLAITSSGTNPNQNLQTAYTLWVRSNGEAVNFAKNWGEDKISFITKKGQAIGTGIIVRETKTKYVVQKVDALGNPEVFKNGTPKLFEAKKSELKEGYPKPAGFTARGNIVAQQLTKIEKVYEAVGKDINKLIEFFEKPQPVSELRKYNKGVPDVDGNVRKVAVGKRNGAFIFGEKIGAFYQNMIGIGDTITMDLWWSRTWNRYMGTMLSTVDGKQVIQETPRTDRERDVMRKAVTLAAEKLNLDVSELQAVIWYFEQELWTKAGNVSPSFSYVTAADALNSKIKTDEQTQKRFSEAGADLTAAEKRRQDAIARANNIIAEGGIQGAVKEQIDFAGSEFINEFSWTEKVFEDGKLKNVTRTEKSDKPIAIRFPDGITAVVRKREDELDEAKQFLKDVRKGVYPYADINVAEDKVKILEGVSEGTDFHVDLFDKNGIIIGGIKLANNHYDYYAPEIGKQLGEDYKNGLIYSPDNRRTTDAVYIDSELQGKGYGARLYHSALRLLRINKPGARLVSNKDTNVSKKAKNFWRGHLNQGLAKVVLNTATPEEIEKIGGPEILKQLKDIGAEYTGDIYELLDPAERTAPSKQYDVVSEEVIKQQIDWERSEFGREKVNNTIITRSQFLQQAVQDLLEGKITNAEYQETVKIVSQIDPIAKFFLPASNQDMENALGKGKSKKLNIQLEDGEYVGLRLDIPAYVNNNIWVVTAHKGNGAPLTYGSVAWATDVKFGTNPKVAAFIAAGKNMDLVGRYRIDPVEVDGKTVYKFFDTKTGKYYAEKGKEVTKNDYKVADRFVADRLEKQDKSTIGKMLGRWKNFEGKTKEERDASAIKKVEEIVKIENSYPGAGRKGSPWRQIGMNPFRHSYFYDRRNGKPVVAAAEVVQIGGLVYAKDVEYADWSSDQFTVDGYYDADGVPVKFQVETKLDKEVMDAIDKGEVPRPLYEKTWYQNLYNALFRTQLEKEILKLQEKKEAKISQFEYEAREIANRIKKYAKSPEALELANEYLVSENKESAREAILKLPKGEQLLENLRVARAYVDNISNKLANDPAFDGLPDDLRYAIQNNVTTYLRATYRFFTDKGFNIKSRRDPAIRAQTKELVAREMALLGSLGLSEFDVNRIISDSLPDIKAEATQMIDSYISDLQDVKYQPSTSGAGIKMPNAPFRAKKDLPEYIKQLLGEEKNPVNRFAQTTKSLANVYYKAEMINGIIDLVGENSEYILDQEPTGVKSKQYEKVNDPYSPLDGKWVHKEVLDMVNQKPLFTSENPALNIYFNTLKLARKSKVIWNITTWRKNLTGGWYFILANGIVNPGFVKDFGQRTNLMFKKTGEGKTVGVGKFKYTFEIDENTKQLMRIMADKGVSGKSIDANMIGVSQAAMQFAMDGNENEYYERVRMVLDNISKKDKWLQEKYAAVDDYTKLIIFRSEIQSFAKKLYGKAYDQLTETQKDNVHEQAAERVKQSTPTFSRLPKWYPKVAWIPIVGDFISFRLESLRSYGENVGNAVADIKKSQDKNLDEVQKKEYLTSGLRRLAGSGAVFALKLAITKTLAQLFLGDDEEELEEDVKLLRPEWMDGQTIIPRSIDKDGNVRVYNYSSEDPYGDVSDIFGGPESWGAALKDFIRPNIAADLIFNLAKGEDIYGRKIADYSDSRINNMLKIIGYTGKQIIVPPTVSSSFRDAWVKSDLPVKDRAVNLASMIAERSIIRDYKYNIVDSFVQDLRKISGTRKAYTDYDNPERRLKQLDDIKDKFESIVAIGMAKGNYDIIKKARRYMKTHLPSDDELYVFEGIVKKPK